MKQETVLPDVQVGQIWKDNDKRGPERYLIVRLVQYWSGAMYAWCEPCDKDGRAVPGRKARINVARFRPISTGYILVGPTTPAPTEPKDGAR